MKERHVAAYRTDARATLQSCGIALGANYLELRPAHVTALLAEAKRIGYTKPAGAKGVPMRHFHDLLQRRAKL